MDIYIYTSQVYHLIVVFSDVSIKPVRCAPGHTTSQGKGLHVVCDGVHQQRGRADARDGDDVGQRPKFFRDDGRLCCAAAATAIAAARGVIRKGSG
jgi:hypothetical protein